MPKKAKRGACYGVIVQYPLACEGPTICVHGKIDMAATDKKLMLIVRRAVPRVPAHVDTSMGPFPGGGATRPLPTPMRDLEVDTISLRRGLSSSETKKLTGALRKANVPFYVRRDVCQRQDER